MMIIYYVALTQTRLAKVSNFAEEKTDLSLYNPLGFARNGHKIWVKISTSYKDESTHLRDL